MVFFFFVLHLHLIAVAQELETADVINVEEDFAVYSVALHHNQTLIQHDFPIFATIFRTE